MTLPDERYRAVVWCKSFLQALAYDTIKYPRVPKSIRTEASSILKHFPTDYDMMRAADTSPEVFQLQMEHVTRLFKKYEEDKLK